MSNASHSTAQDATEPRPGGAGVTALQRLLMWLILSVLTLLVVYFGFRAVLES